MENNKNNPSETPQADGDVNAGGQVDLEALKAQIASQNTAEVAASQTVPEQTTPTETAPQAEAKKYAGKFTDPNALEEGYVNLEKKLGQKSDLERIGEKLFKYSGRELNQLEAELDIALQTPGSPTASPQVASPQAPPDQELAVLKSEVQAMKVKELTREMSEQKEALLKEHPEAARYASTIEDLWKNVDVKKSFKEIYESRFKSSEDANQAQQDDKDKANFRVESSVGKQAGGFEAVNPENLTLEQLKQVLPRANNY
jgi:hypothetical protein